MILSTILENTTYTRTDKTLHAVVKKLRAKTKLSTFDSNCCCDNNKRLTQKNWNSKIYSMKLRVHNRFLSTEGILNVQHAPSCARSVVFSSKVNQAQLIWYVTIEYTPLKRCKTNSDLWKMSIFVIKFMLQDNKQIFVHRWRKHGENGYDNLKCKACCDVLSNPFENQTPKVELIRGEAKRRVMTRGRNTVFLATKEPQWMTTSHIRTLTMKD